MPPKKKKILKLHCPIRVKKPVQESAKLFEIIVKSSPHAIVIHRKNKIEYVNPQAMSALGAKSAAELIGQPISRFIHPDSLPIVIERLNNQKYLAQPTKEVYLRLDGTSIDAEAVTSLIFYKGKPAFESIITDITDRKWADEKLKKIYQIKTDFIAVASHELRNPLTGIELGIELVLGRTGGEINPKQEEYLNAAKRGVNRLKSLINNLLDISKIEAGKVEIKPQSVDLVKEVNDVLAQMKSQAEAKKLTLAITSKPENTLAVLADPEKLNEIFVNLLSNSIKFTEEQGQVSIAIVDRGDHAEINIIDTGMGIAKEDLPKLFGKFQQFNRAPGPELKGTGLGLAITKGLVELQGGKIWAESEVGKGTKFTFTIPKGR